MHATRPRSRISTIIIIAAAPLATLPSLPARAQTASAASARIADPWQPFIDEAAARFAVPGPWIRAVIRVESGGHPGAVSAKGAVGLMQLMPDTYAELRARYGLGSDPADPHDNIVAGAAYLRDMHERFGHAGFIAAYNAGPQRYEDHLATGRPLPDETLAYVAQLGPLLSGGSPIGNPARMGNHSPWQQSPLFVMRRSDGSADTLSAFVPQAKLSHSDRSIADLSALVPPSGNLFVRKPNSRAHP